jgi:hypothetical protein
VKIYDGSLDENFFQNPKNLFDNFRKVILGPNEPQPYVKWFYWINTFISFIFLGWHLLGFLAVVFRNIIFEKKKVAVDVVISSYAKKAEFTINEFIVSLQIHHSLSAIIWMFLLVVMVLFWRRKKWIFMFVLFSLLFYFLQGIFIFGWQFITHELTLFDWICLSVYLGLIAIDTALNLNSTKESDTETI